MTHAHFCRTLSPGSRLWNDSFQPQPLAFLEEDIREVLKQETGADIFSRVDQPDYRLWKQTVSVVFMSNI